MSMKAQVKTQAKTSAGPTAAHIPQPRVAEREREAERPDIATQLEGATRLGHILGAITISSAPPIIQRQEVPEEEELQMKREPSAIQRQELREEEEEEEEEELQMKTEIGGLQRHGRGEGFRLDEETTSRINRARGGGQLLDGTVQAQMAETMGHDFSGVRVHADSEADALNQRLSARAFTTDLDIFFRRGAYDPSSTGGQELIAHELSHVVQQSTGRVPSSGPSLTVRPPGDTFEQEADVIGRGATQKKSIGPLWGTPAMAVPADILAPQRRYGNRAVRRHARLVSRAPRPLIPFRNPENRGQGRKDTAEKEELNRRIQRMIVTGQDEDGEEDLAALSTIGVYLIQSPQERVEVMGQANYSDIPDTEQLLIVGHGEDDRSTIAGKNVAEFDEELKTPGRRLGASHKYIGLAACYSAMPDNPFAAELGGAMHADYQDLKVEGVPGDGSNEHRDL